MSRTSFFSILAFGTVLMAQPALARDLVRAEDRLEPFTGHLSACDDPAVLLDISSRFADRESDYWASPLKIAAFESAAPVAFRPWGPDYIPRAFCTGVVVTSDGARRRIAYSIKESGGAVFGSTQSIEWCIVGLDRSLSYAPGCRAAQP